MAKWHWDRMAGIYLDGRRYDLALTRPGRQRPQRELPSAGKPREPSGNIAFHQSSSGEDCRAVALVKAGSLLAPTASASLRSSPITAHQPSPPNCNEITHSIP